MARINDSFENMALLPIRHQQREFFVLDIADVVLKDDTASMEHPLFSLMTRPDMRHLRYENGENYIEITPSGAGLPTIHDKDILIFCISQLMHRKNQGEPIGKRVRFSARELMITTNRPTDNKAYIRLKAAFKRLIGTTFTTNIITEQHEETRIFTLLESGSGFIEKKGKEGKRRLDYCEVFLSDWFMSAIESASVVTISEDYFRLRNPLQRRLYEIARKHCNKQKYWKIGLNKLQDKTGSSAPLYRFRFNLRKTISLNEIPDYTFELTADDMVTVRPRKPINTYGDKITLPEWAEERARVIAKDKGYDYYALRREWLEWAKGKAPPKDAGAAFIGFCKSKPPLR